MLQVNCSWYLYLGIGAGTEYPGVSRQVHLTGWTTCSLHKPVPHKQVGRVDTIATMINPFMETEVNEATA